MIKRIVSTLLLIIVTVSIAGYADLYLPKYASNGRGGNLPELMANCQGDVMDDIPVEELVYTNHERIQHLYEELSLRANEIEIELPEPYMEAYYDFLLEYCRQDKMVSGFETRFLFAYIDEDDIPELLVVDCPSRASSVSVYTYYEGKVMELGAYGSWGGMGVIERTGMIVGCYDGHGCYYTYYYHISKRQERELCEFLYQEHYSLDSEDAEISYKIDDVEVTQEEFEEQYNRYWSDEYQFIGYDEGVKILPEHLKKSLLAMKYIADSRPWKILDAYEEFLNEILKEGANDKVKKYFYALMYLDEDNIPELILFDTAADVLQPEVYIYQQDRVAPAKGMEDMEIEYIYSRYTSLDDAYQHFAGVYLRDQLRVANGVNFNGKD